MRGQTKFWLSIMPQVGELPLAAEEVVVAVSRREQAKDERRARIIQAAVSLLNEGDPKDITVSMIADRARVNAMTVYNLFGTKAAVLAGAFDHDVNVFAERVKAIGSEDPLERIFEALTIATEMYRTRPEFYRALMGSASSLTDEDWARAVQASRLTFWREALQEALDAGQLRPRTDVPLLAAVLIQISAGAIAQWGGKFITLEELDLETKYGFAMLLLAAASPAVAPRLKKRLKELSKAWRAPHLAALR